MERIEHSESEVHLMNETDGSGWPQSVFVEGPARGDGPDLAQGWLLPPGEESGRRAFLAAYENARQDGLCHEGAWECALDAMRRAPLIPST